MNIASARAQTLSLMVSLIRRERRYLVVIILAYVVPYCATLVLYQGYFPDVHGLRYLDLSIHLIVVPIAWFLTTALRGSLGPRRHRAIALGAITVVLIGSTWIEYRNMVITRTWSKGMGLLPLYSQVETDGWWSFLDRVRLELEPGTVVAAKDFGRLAYFSEVRVVDLVGIVDPSIVASRRNDAIAEFLREGGVEYVVTPPSGGFPVHNEIRDNATLDPVAGFPQQEATGYLLHRVLNYDSGQGLTMPSRTARRFASSAPLLSPPSMYPTNL